jgi:hypothetical protein
LAEPPLLDEWRDVKARASTWPKFEFVHVEKSAEDLAEPPLLDEWRDVKADGNGSGNAH